MTGVAEERFACMGTRVRIVCGPGAQAPATAAAAARAWLEGAAARLSRFVPASELVALNADPREIVPASPLLRAAVAAGLWAAWRTAGLADPTLLGALEEAGYERSRADAPPASAAVALALAPPRTPARPDPRARWRTVEVRDGAIARAPGMRLDTGGTGKGLLADAVAGRLAGQAWCLVDCGGDIRIGGRPFPVDVVHPVTGTVADRLTLSGGAIATSGLGRHVWFDADGRPSHHLIDPSRGVPAWSGLAGATALAPTALEAETLAKAAFLRGPEGARRSLAAHGGLLLHEDGSTEPVGRLLPAAAA